MKTTIFILSLIFSVSALADGGYEVPVSKKDKRFTDKNGNYTNINYNDIYERYFTRYKAYKCSNGKDYAVVYTEYFNINTGDFVRGAQINHTCNLKNTNSLESCLRDGDPEARKCGDEASQFYNDLHNLANKGPVSSKRTVDSEVIEEADTEALEIKKFKAGINSGVLSSTNKVEKCVQSASGRINCSVNVGSHSDGNNNHSGSLTIPTHRSHIAVGSPRGNRDIPSNYIPRSDGKN